MRGRKGYGFIALLALLLLSATGAFAADKTWTGGASDGGKWNTAGNWDGGVPFAADTAIFNEDVTVDLDAAANAMVIQIANGKSVTLNTSTNALTISGGSIQIGAGSTLTVDGGNGVKFSAGAGGIKNEGRLIGTNGGKIDIPAATTVAYIDSDKSEINLVDGIVLADAADAVLKFNDANVGVQGDSLKGGAASVIQVTNGSVLGFNAAQSFPGTVKLNGGTLNLREAPNALGNAKLNFTGDGTLQVAFQALATPAATFGGKITGDANAKNITIEVDKSYHAWGLDDTHKEAKLIASGADSDASLTNSDKIKVVADGWMIVDKKSSISVGGAAVALDADKRTVKLTADKLPTPISSDVTDLKKNILITADGAVTPPSFEFKLWASSDVKPTVTFDPAAKGFSVTVSDPTKLESDNTWVTNVLVVVGGSPLTESYQGNIVVAYGEKDPLAGAEARIKARFDVTNNMTGGGGGGGGGGGVGLRWTRRGGGLPGEVLRKGEEPRRRGDHGGLLQGEGKRRGEVRSASGGRHQALRDEQAAARTRPRSQPGPGG